MYSDQMINEDMLGVLIYLFERHIKPDFSLQFQSDVVTSELENRGFSLEAIYGALDWLDNLNPHQHKMEFDSLKTQALRIFNTDECGRIDVESRNYIMQTERIGLLTPTDREMVISQIMELDNNHVDLNQTKLVMLMVLFENPDQNRAILYANHITTNNNIEDMQ